MLLAPPCINILHATFPPFIFIFFSGAGETSVTLTRDLQDLRRDLNGRSLSG